MLKQKIKNKINNHQILFKIFFTVFFVIPILILYFIEPVYAVYSFILYSYFLVYLYMEDTVKKQILTGFFVIWVLIFIPITATYASSSDLFKEKIFFVFKIIFPFINMVLYVFGIST